VDKAQAEQAQREEIEKLGEEGRRRRKEKEDGMLRRVEEEENKKTTPTVSSSISGPFGQPPIGPHDTTVRLKYKLATHPNLTTPSALASQLAVFGPVDTGAIVLSIKPNKKQPEKPPKFATALVPFEKAGDAYACYCSAGKAERGLDDVEISWVAGEEPKIIRWLRMQGKPNASAATSEKIDASFASFPTSFVSTHFRVIGQI
jgi:DnaJ family protein C protein 17